MYTEVKLKELIKNSYSIDKEEKQYWFDIIPNMDERQKERLYDILENERVKLEELEKKYWESLKELDLILNK